MGTMASAVGTRANYNEVSSHSFDGSIPRRSLSTASVRFRALAWEPGAPFQRFLGFFKLDPTWCECQRHALVVMEFS